MNPDLTAAAATWCDYRRVKILRTPSNDRDWWYAGEHQTIAPAAAADEWATIPPLVDQLQAATIPSGETGKGSGRGTGGGPDWDALDILDRLRDTVDTWRNYGRLTGRVPLARGIRQVATQPWPEHEGAQLARVLADLADRADAHLTPADVAPTRPVRGVACPQCGALTVPGHNQYGEPAPASALLVVLNRGLIRYVTCQACSAQWDRSELEHWAGIGA
jgi:hypothetical protein